jgi:hypothetical protein
MKFVLICANADSPSRTWEEPYNRPDCETLEEAKQWAEDTVKMFNNTLRSWEKPRVLLDVIEKDNDSVAPHEWHKTNLVTVVKGKQNYDEMFCLRCHITGKRYGIGDNGVERDKKYKHQKYASCDPERNK